MRLSNYRVKNKAYYSRLLPLVALLILLTGCLKSLKPFYKVEQLTDATQYDGVWQVSEDNYWVFVPLERLEEENVKENGLSDLIPDSMIEDELGKRLRLLFTVEDSLTAHLIFESLLTNDEPEIDEDLNNKVYIAAFFPIENRMMMDLTPFQILGDNTLSGRHHIPVHTLSLVDDFGADEKLRFNFFNASKIEQLINEKKVRIKREYYNMLADNVDDSEEMVLTADTEELQAFIRKLISMGDESFLSSGKSYTMSRVK